MVQMEGLEAPLEEEVACRQANATSLFLAQWHQWLRYTRPSPPTISEQQADATRQRELKHLVQAADARWAAKPSVLDRPRRVNLELGAGDGEVGGTVGGRGEGVNTGPAKIVQKGKQIEKPWKVKQGSPGEGWQPEAWTPGPSKD
ncbi:hypothetical protein MMC07_008426 [Pseudocyphellaria aurata]|nr:hypothetical protein [Pseudocyphellaria aurata]